MTTSTSKDASAIEEYAKGQAARIVAHVEKYVAEEENKQRGNGVSAEYRESYSVRGVLRKDVLPLSPARGPESERYHFVENDAGANHRTQVRYVNGSLLLLAHKLAASVRRKSRRVLSISTTQRWQQ